MDQQQAIKSAKKRHFEDSGLPLDLPHPKSLRSGGYSGTQYNLRVLPQKKSYSEEASTTHPEDPEDPDFLPLTENTGEEDDPAEYEIPPESEEDRNYDDLEIGEKKREKDGEVQCYYCDKVFKYPLDRWGKIRRRDTGDHYSREIHRMKKEIKVCDPDCDDYEELSEDLRRYLKDIVYVCHHHDNPFYIPPCCMDCLIVVDSRNLECPFCVGPMSRQ